MNRLVPILIAAALLALLPSCAYRLDTAYSDLLVGTPSDKAPLPRGNQVQVTYLGTNAYLIRSAGTTIVVDPYFSRIDLRSVVFNADVSPSPAIITEVSRKAKLGRHVDGYLVTHSHFDHLFDVPPMQRMYGGKVITSPTGAYLAEAAGVSRRQLLPSKPGKIYRIGEAKVRVLPAWHDKVLGRIPYPGTIDTPLPSEPDKPKDYRLGIPLAFLVELNGKRIYVESGGIPGHIPCVTGVDLAIVGVAVPGSQKRYPDTVRTLNPKYVLPSHQDNFFLPIEDGFQFSTLSNFPKILATHKAADLPGELILMDYFRSWMVE